MFENTFQGPGTGTYIDHTIEILLMLLVAFLLGLLLGYILWYKWQKLYQELNAEHNRLKAVLLDLEKEHVSVKYKLEESEKDNTNLRRKIMSLDGDIAGLRFRLEKSESDLAAALAANQSEHTGHPNKPGHGHKPPKKEEAPIEPVVVVLTTPISADKEDLKIVEGIGPKIEKLCNDKGIWTFTELANTSLEALQEMLDEAGPDFRSVDPQTWKYQAELAAAGKWEELKAYINDLKGL